MNPLVNKAHELHAAHLISTYYYSKLMISAITVQDAIGFFFLLGSLIWGFSKIIGKLDAQEVRNGYIADGIKGLQSDVNEVKTSIAHHDERIKNLEKTRI